MEWYETTEKAIRQMLESANDLMLEQRYRDARIVLECADKALRVFINNCEITGQISETQSDEQG